MSHALLGTGIVAALGLAAWGLFKVHRYPAIAAGYRAKVVCSAVFGSGRTFDESLWTQVSADSYRPLRLFRVDIDRDTKRVTASLFGAFARTAIHREGLGATLLFDNRPAITLPAGAPLARHRPRWEWPELAGSTELRRLVEAAFEEPEPRRLRRTYAVVVVRDGIIVAERYAPGFDAQMPMPGWSMAKSVINALAGQLVQEGRLSLDQRQLMPSWRLPDARAAVTLEDLLRMRSGLRFSEAYGAPWSDVLRMLYCCHDAAAFAASLPLAARPGSVWQYSSGTTNILSHIIRRTVGDGAYREWPSRVLFDRLGMTSAVMEPDGSGTFIGSSYMLATARDWARFGQLFLDRGRWQGQEILSSDWVRFSTTPTPESPNGRFGAHWWLKLSPEIGGDSPAAGAVAPDAFFAVGHEGQTLSVVPSKRLVVVRLGASIYVDAWDQATFLAGVQETA